MTEDLPKSRTKIKIKSFLEQRKTTTKSKK